MLITKERQPNSGTKPSLAERRILAFALEKKKYFYNKFQTRVEEKTQQICPHYLKRAIKMSSTMKNQIYMSLIAHEDLDVQLV